MSQGEDRRRVAELLGIGTHHTDDLGTPPPTPGGQRVVTLRGPAGIGKTELVRWAMSAWPAGRPVVRVQGGHLDRDVPFGGVDQILAGARRRGDSPVSDSPSPDLGERPSDNAELRLATDVIDSLDRLGDDGGLLVIDDAHWIDESSRRVIEFALRRLDDRAPATIIAERPGVPMIPHAPRIDISGLSRDEAEEIATRHGWPSNSVDEAWESSDGHPLLFIDRLAAAETGEIVNRPAERAERAGASIAQALLLVEHRHRAALALLALARNGDDLEQAWRSSRDETTTSFAETVAEASDQIRATAGVRIVDADLPATERAPGTGQSAGLRPGTGRPRFVHAEYARAASDAVAGDIRRRLSAALAAHASDGDAAALHLAESAAGPDDDVARLVGASARRAAERGSSIEAARLFERAASLSADPEHRVDHALAAGESWWYACFPAETARVTEHLGSEAVDLRRRVRARQLHRAAVGWQRHVLETIRGSLDDADLVAGDDPEMAAGLRVNAFVEACLGGQAGLALEIVDALTDGVESVDEGEPFWPTVASVCRAFVAVIQGRAGRPERVTSDVASDLGTLRFVGTLDLRKLETTSLSLFQLIGFAFTTLDEADAAATTLAELRTEAHARGAVAITDFTDACLAEVDRRSGRWASALSRTMSDLDIDPSRTSAGKAWQRAIRARMLAVQGAEVDDLVRSVLEEAEPVGMEFIVATARIAGATAALAAGDVGRAIELAQRVDHEIHRGGAFEAGVLWSELDHIEALWRGECIDDLRRLTDRLAEQAEFTGRPWTQAMAALGSTLLDDPTDAAAIATALATADGLGGGIEGPRLQLLLAEYLAATGQSSTAGRGMTIDVAELRATFARFGAAPFVERCNRLQHPESGDSAQAGLLVELTDAELRVAVTVAAGRTNAEAAAELFLSSRTVEAHLRAIFRKLSIRNRVELAAVVAESQTGRHRSR